MGLPELRLHYPGGNHAAAACEVDRRKPGGIRHRRALLLAERLLVSMDSVGENRAQIPASAGRSSEAKSRLQHAAGAALGGSRGHTGRGRHDGASGGLRHQCRRLPGGSAGGRSRPHLRSGHAGQPAGV